MRRRSRTIATCLVLALAVLSCSGGDDDAPTAESADDPDDDSSDDDDDDDDDDDGSLDAAEDAERRTLRMGAFGADIQSLDPHRATTGVDRQMMKPLFSGLVRYKPGDVTAPFETDLATEIPDAPEPNEDGTQTWEFTIREGTMCHPGPDTDAYELTAEDVVYSLDRARDPDRSSFAGDYGTVESVQETGEYTVEVVLSSPRSQALFFPLVADYAGGYVVCKAAVEAADGGGEFHHPVGTGPFVFGEYNPGLNIQLVANDDYFRGPPRLAGIDYRFMADDSSRSLALEAGELDLIVGPVEQEWVTQMDAKEGISAIPLAIGGLHFFQLNTSMEPFDDLLVRQAIGYAMDRDAHVARSGEGVAEKVWSVVHAPNGPGGLSEQEVRELGLEFEHDPDRARELLAEAGYPDGFSFEVVTSEFDVYRNNYQVLQANLAEVGIDMQISVVDHPTMHSVIREGSNGIVSYFAPRPTADQLLFHFLHSDSIVVEGVAPIANFAYYDGIDQYIEEAQLERDPELQEELWRQANIQVLEDAVTFATYMGNNTFAYQDDFDPGHEPIATLESSFVINHETGFHD